MRTDDLDFHLPPHLIAQTPPPERTASRLLHYRRHDRAVSHLTFADLPSLLRPGDLLVFNNTRVLPARFALRKPTGGRVDGLFLSEPAPGQWRVLLRNLGPPRPDPLHVDGAPTLRATVSAPLGDGEHLLTLTAENAPVPPAPELLAQIGRMPLPPYIKRDKDGDARDALDRERYQTVFAQSPGAVAAPTAALHFSDTLLRQLDDRGVQRTFVTLHVGVGTFKPVTADRLEDHAMHAEPYTVDDAATDAINRAKAEGRRVIAVGTTSARVLESQPPDEPIAAATGQTQIFIYPPYRWRHTDALITNFHLPRSTLIALVAALVGLDEQRRIYQLAVEQNYRFFSYGDAMFVE
jgi:S-adenosylmethionine:tRNA ribosyltransferase-isomerase